MINSITSPFFIAFGVSIIWHPLTFKEKPEWVPLNPLMLTVWFFVSWHICNLLCEETLTAVLWIESEVKVFSFFTHSFLIWMFASCLDEARASPHWILTVTTPPPTPQDRILHRSWHCLSSLPHHSLARNRNYRTTCGGLRSVSMA